METKRTIEFMDTMTGRRRVFEPINPDIVTIYSCGPTVYDFAHIGNFRNFVFVDVLRRSLKLLGYPVKHVMNITDIDDKIIRNSAKEGIGVKELAECYEKAFFEDCRFLKLEKMEHYPRAVEHIPEMIDLVQRLIDKGFTYQMDGSVYFRISSFKAYGRLAKLNQDGMMSGVRVDSDEYAKDDVRDFVLWKGHKSGEPFWDAPFGKGRPGWHLECSAMSTRYLGKTFDIHTGAEDLVFPHHENEIAQSEAANGQTFVRYWLHCAFLNMKAQKMSKSLGNIITIRSLAEAGHDPAVIRYFLMSVHYRKPLLYSEDGLESAKSAVQRIRGFYQRLTDYLKAPGKESGPNLQDKITNSRNEFYSACSDDLNTSRALAAVFELIRYINPLLESQELTHSDANTVNLFFIEFNRIADLLENAEELLPVEIEKRIEQRQQARRDRDFALSDRIRDELKANNIILEDTRDGVRWRKI